MKSLASRDTPTSSVRSKFQRIVGAASPQQRKTATIAATVAIVGIVTIATPDPAYAQSANLEGFANNVLGLLSNGLLRAQYGFCACADRNHQPAPTAPKAQETDHDSHGHVREHEQR